MLARKAALQVALRHVHKFDNFTEDLTKLDEKVLADVESGLVEVAERAAICELILAHAEHLRGQIIDSLIGVLLEDLLVQLLNNLTILLRGERLKLV